MRRVMLVCALVWSPSLFAASVTVNFKANLRAVTCITRIVVEGSNAVNQTIDFGNFTRSTLEEQGANTRKEFSLQYSDCGLGFDPTQIKTSVKASATWSGYITELKGGDNGAAAVLYRADSPNSLLSLNGATVDWSSSERTAKTLNLILSLRPTSASTSSISGTFNGSLTFTTTFQ